MLVGLWSYTFCITGSLHGLTPQQGAHRQPLRVLGLQPPAGRRGRRARRHVRICRPWGFSRRATSTSAIVTGVWNVMARIALPVVAIGALWFGGVTLPDALTDLAVAGMVTGLGILATFVAVMASERAAQAIGRGLDRVLGPLLRRPSGADSPMSIDELVHDLRARINDVVGSGWWSMSLGMIGFFGAYYVLFVLVMRETGVILPLNLLFAAFAIGRLLTAVGITPGGVGVTETATAAVLVALGGRPGRRDSRRRALLDLHPPHGGAARRARLAPVDAQPEGRAARRGRGGGLRARQLTLRREAVGRRTRPVTSALERRKTIAIGVCSLPCPSGLSANISSKRDQSPGTSEPRTLRPMSLASMITVPPKVERHGSGTRSRIAEDSRAATASGSLGASLAETFDG